MIGELMLLAMLVGLPDIPPPDDTPVMEPWAPDTAQPQPPAAQPTPEAPPSDDKPARKSSPDDDDAEPTTRDHSSTRSDGKLHPLLWGVIGMTAGTALGLGVAAPLGLLFGSVAALTSLQSLNGPAGRGGAIPPFVLLQMVAGPLTSCATMTCCGYLLWGAPAAGTLAGVMTMLGAAYQGKRKMPWVPTLAATILPRWLGTLGGSCLWLGASCAVGLVSALFVFSAILQGNFNNATAFLSSPGYYVLNCMLSAACPVAMMGGSALGDLVGLALLWPINSNLSRDVEADENPLPKAMMAEEELDDGDDEEEEDRPRKKKMKKPRKRRRRDEDEDEEDEDLDDG